MGILAAALTATVLAPLAVRIDASQHELLSERERASLAAQTAPYARALADAVNRKIALQEALFAFTQTRRTLPSFPDDFQKFAAGLHSNSPGVRALEVMPDGVIRFVYPLAGNEMVVGRRIYDHPLEEVRADIRRCIETRRVTLTGPIELWQGGAGFIARRAVFDGDRVWGFVTTILGLPAIFEESGLAALYPGTRVAVKDARGRVFWGDAAAFGSSPVTHTIPLADGAWEAGFAPAAGWGAEHRQTVMWMRTALGLIGLMLCAASAWAASRFTRMRGVIRTREAQYRAVLDALPVLIAEIGPDGRYRFANRARCEWFGSSSEQLEGRRYQDVVQPPAWPELLGDIQAGLRGVSSRREMTVPHPSKGLRRLEVQTIPKRDHQGNLDGLYLMGVDITAPSEIEEERNRFFTLSNALFCIAGTTGHFKTLNPAWSDTLGYSSHELASKPLLEFVHPEDREATLAAVRILKTGRSVISFENRVLAKDGSYRWLRWNSTPFQENSLVYAAANDVTEQRQLEEQLRQAQKLESVGRLAGGIAHDFNNLLTVINGYSDLLLARLGDSDRLRDSILEIRKAGQRAADLTQQLLAFSRRQSRQARVIRLNDVISDAEKMLRRLMGEDIEIVSELAADLGTVWADPAQMQQVLINLAVNARDAMPGGGRLTIRTENVRLDPTSSASFPALEPGEYILWTVSDTGTGMDATVKAHLFEPFFTTKPPGSGTGLGLSTVYGIVQQSRGWIGVTSEPGQGTTFRILLPRFEGASEDEAAVETAAAAPLGGETVLIAEDQPEIRHLAGRILREYGYTVIEAENGEDALKKAQEYPGVIHLLLSDVVMPGMSGPELAGRLQALRPQTGVLLMSGYPGGEVTAGLQKPFTPEELASAVRTALDQRQ